LFGPVPGADLLLVIAQSLVMDWTRIDSESIRKKDSGIRSERLLIPWLIP
jgi:hypothetical protein